MKFGEKIFKITEAVFLEMVNLSCKWNKRKKEKLTQSGHEDPLAVLQRDIQWHPLDLNQWVPNISSLVCVKYVNELLGTVAFQYMKNPVCTVTKSSLHSMFYNRKLMKHPS